MMKYEGKIDLSKEIILSRVQMKLVSGENFEKRFHDVPHTDLLDMKAVFQVKLEDNEADIEKGEGCTANVIISYATLDTYEITEDELIKAAGQNTFDKNEFTIDTMSNVLGGMIGHDVVPEIPKDEPQLYVVTNEQKQNGATVLMYPALMQAFFRMTGKPKVYVIPSSIHEVLIYDDPDADPNVLRSMVIDINRTHVAHDEVLSNEVYVLDKEGLRVA